VPPCPVEGLHIDGLCLNHVTKTQCCSGDTQFTIDGEDETVVNISGAGITRAEKFLAHENLHFKNQADVMCTEIWNQLLLT